MQTTVIELTNDTQISVTQDMQYVLRFPDLNTQQSYSVIFNFEKEGVSAEVIGLYKLDQGQRLDLTTTVDHRVPYTSCLVAIKGTIVHQATSKYLGKIMISKFAQQTSSFLRDDVLLLGDAAFVRTKPVLNIEANDVKASHAATTGRIDESKVYYLMSRGLNLGQSREVIIQGFFHELLDKIHDEKLRKDIQLELS